MIIFKTFLFGLLTLPPETLKQAKNYQDSLKTPRKSPRCYLQTIKNYIFQSLPHKIP